MADTRQKGGKSLLDIQQKLEDARYLIIAAELAVPAATGDKREAAAVSLVLQMALPAL